MMNFDVYCNDKKMGTFYADGRKEQVGHNLLVDCLFRMSADDLLRQRVLPEARWDSNAQAFYGLDNWDAWEICRRTHGIKPTDDVWLKFHDDPEGFSYADALKQVW